MKFKIFKTTILAICCTLTVIAQQKTIALNDFKNPAQEFRPMPFWHINGTLTDEGIVKQLTDSKAAGFSGVAVLPLDSTLPEYLGNDYFDRYRTILETAKKLGMNIILYDDTGFPSGTAGGIIEREYPQFLRKSLDKTEVDVSGLPFYKCVVPQGKLMAAVAMDMTTKKRIDLKPFIVNNLLSWQVPRGGNWRVLFFNNDPASFWKKNMPLDAMDPKAMDQFMKLTYDEYAKRFSSYFTNTIKLTYFDDVGFLRRERTWTGLFNEKFKELNGYNPDLFYPALWYDIGPETQAARVAFFNTRSELLAEGYTKTITEWTNKHGLENTGHPPGNYGIQPVDMHGDIFKFFRYTSRPLADAIIDYGHGRDGFKLISSAADLYDRPIVTTEVYGAFKENTVDVNMLYRTIMELFARGINFAVPHGEWYEPTKVGIPPLVSPYSEKLGPALPAYSSYVGRSCYLLQGGRKISEIGIVYPISSLQGAYYFDALDNKRAGSWAYSDADYLKISDILTNEIRRDFTFIHPEYLATDKYQITAGNLHLNNKENYQDYKTIIIPGGSVIALNTLQKIKKFYDEGGKVIATTLLPSQSIKVEEDEKVKAIVSEMFGKDAVNNASIQTNAKGGKAIFVKQPSKENLAKAIESLAAVADLIFENLDNTKSELGMFSYLHKLKDGKDIYFFANSSDDVINTTVLIKGKHNLQSWNPYQGTSLTLKKLAYVIKGKDIYTKYQLALPAVKSVFWVGK
jgi:hypothetical protein